jgi:hypothetical protein
LQGSFWAFRLKFLRQGRTPSRKPGCAKDPRAVERPPPAAVFTLSALGLLTDVSCDEPGDGPCPAPSLFRRRLFAISSVSGGSVGAAAFAEALADAGRSGAPPCTPDRPSARYFKRDHPSWRGCLQKILAEDFLSPAIAGLRFRDVVGFAAASVGPCVWPDRGRRIESATADAYLGFTGQPEGGCAADRRRGHDAPLASLSPAQPGAVAWAPNLLADESAARVRDRLEGVSMSWWLPKPVQQYLDNQLEMPIGDRQRALVRADFDANAASFKRVCAVMAGGDFAKMRQQRIAALAH